MNLKGIQQQWQKDHSHSGFGKVASLAKKGIALHLQVPSDALWWLP